MHARTRAHRSTPEPAITTTHAPGRVRPPFRPPRTRVTVTAPSSRTPAYVVLVPVALSLALGLWGVRRGGTMWRDEAVTCDIALRPLPDLWATLGHADAVHGLYYLLMHALFELSPGADPLLLLRLPSVLATAAATGTLALLAHRLTGPRAGLLSGVVFTLLPPVQRYAQEGRSYALVCALVVWASYLLVRAVRVRTGRAWLAYGAVALAACLLHEFAVLALAAHFAALPGPSRRPGARTMAGVCVCLSPLAVLSTRQTDQVAWIGGVGAGALLGFGGVTVLGVGCAVVLKRTGITGITGLALPLLALPPLLLLLLSLAKPLYVDRYVLYAQAGLALLVGAALDRLARAGGRVGVVARLTAVAAVLALLPVTLQLRTAQSRTDDVTAVAEAVRAVGHDADGVLYLPARRRIWSLPDPGPFRGLRDLALDGTPTTSHTLYGTEAPAPVIRARMLATPRIVALRDPAGQPVDRTPEEEVKRQVLARYFVECGTRRVQGARVTVYARPGHCQ
ncbi:glycosyltransferase family 39 protein [Streptomyces sp. NPDC057257]|uniref:glycosyltransferase family 39 protein n=1 Tax=Streptomyces sp. NPDC057257 TaxID=3346071 RepID=UPI00363E056B